MKIKLTFFAVFFLLQSQFSFSQSWIEVNSPPVSTFSTIEWVDQNFFWASNNSSQGLYYSSDGGYTYSSVLPQSVLSDIEPVSSDSIFVINKTADKPYNFLMFSSDRGAIFQEYVITNNGDTGFKDHPPVRVFVFDNRHYSILGDSTEGCMEIWNTSDAGQSWSRLDCGSINFDNGKFTHLSFAPIVEKFGSMAIMKTYDESNFLYRISDYGNNWEKIAVPEEVQLWPWMAFSDSLTGLCVRRFSATTSLAVTHDGGYTWDTAYDVPHSFSFLEWVPEGNEPGFFISYGAEGSYLSFSQGEKWEKIEKIDKKSHANISFYNSEAGVSSFVRNANGQGMRVWTGFTSSLAEAKIPVAAVYPNPFFSSLNVESENAADYSLYNVTGKLVKVGNIKSDLINNIALDELQAGFYFLVLRNEYGNQSYKLVKE